MGTDDLPVRQREKVKAHDFVRMGQREKVKGDYLPVGQSEELRAAVSAVGATRNIESRLFAWRQRKKVAVRLLKVACDETYGKRVSTWDAQVVNEVLETMKKLEES